MSSILPIGVVHISTYIPRKCGIATFTKDLTTGINHLNPAPKAAIIALDDPELEPVTYPAEVVKTIVQSDKHSYGEAAAFINNSPNINVVSIQHEFGIFGGESGDFVVPFVAAISKPLVITLHTVLLYPSQKQLEIIKTLVERAQAIVVMLNKSKEVLIEVYDAPKEKITVISHGVPDFPRLDTTHWKKKLGLLKHTVMASINLISESKGLEYAIESLPQIIVRYPDFLYLIIGQTHPGYLRSQRGHDTYREKLTALVNKLHLSRHVRFVNKYLRLEEVVEYIGASDFYITPYLDPQQAASGSLAYALGAGKVCIATPYLYAKEMLSHGRGFLVPFRSSRAISNTLVNLFKHPDTRSKIESAAYEIGKTMSWVNVGHQYFHLFQYVKHHSV